MSDLISAAKQAKELLEGWFTVATTSEQYSAAIAALHQAISQPDCRGCDSFVYGDELYKDGCNAASVCTNGDKFQACLLYTSDAADE